MEEFRRDKKGWQAMLELGWWVERSGEGLKNELRREGLVGSAATGSHQQPPAATSSHQQPPAARRLGEFENNKEQQEQHTNNILDWIWLGWSVEENEGLEEAGGLWMDLLDVWGMAMSHWVENERLRWEESHELEKLKRRHRA
jgi:hypothetical protein